ncbi:hypothetical protein [Riemerella phage vB_RanS_PT33]|nr:hypothetical protein [Riemerella phage vB_RanS_PT03]UUJ74536.1 hypothetical protein [Riemerella phage vB_RanS_PT15]UVK80395.1 hypothetical protein [Riemerella phage vB_RanS_PT33]
MPTLSTLLKDCFISAKLDQSASFTTRYQRQTSMLYGQVGHLDTSLVGLLK